MGKEGKKKGVRGDGGGEGEKVRKEEKGKKSWSRKEMRAKRDDEERRGGGDVKKVNVRGRNEEDVMQIERRQ